MISEKHRIPPTDEFYNLLSTAFNHFNKELFASTLPHCLLTVQRERVVGEIVSWIKEQAKRSR